MVVSKFHTNIKLWLSKSIASGSIAAARHGHFGAHDYQRQVLIKTKDAYG